MNDKYDVRVDTIIRTIVLVLALTNQVLTSLGKPIIPITDDQVTELITLAITIGTSIWAWWKNNSFTQEAIQADEYMRRLKKDE